MKKLNLLFFITLSIFLLLTACGTEVSKRNDKENANTSKETEKVMDSFELPEEEINISLSIDQNQYTFNDTVILTLENNGGTDVFYGSSYDLEFYKSNGWHRAPINVNFDSIGLTLKSKISAQQTIELNKITEKKPGKYRLLKSIKVEQKEINKTLVVEFEILK